MQSAIASLNVYNSWLDNSANNVANSTASQGINLKSTVTAEDNAPKLQTTTQQKPVSLTQEMTDQAIIPDAAEASADAIRTQDKMTGTLLDILA